MTAAASSSRRPPARRVAGGARVDAGVPARAGSTALATAVAAAPRPVRRAPVPATPLSVVAPVPRTRVARQVRPARAPRAPFVVLLLVLMGSGLLCLLLLNTALGENAFRVQKLQAESSALADEEQTLSVRNDRLSAPGALAARAATLGMEPGGLPEYLPPGSPLPKGARVVAGGADSGVVFFVVPAPPADPAAATAAGQPPAGQPPAAADGTLAAGAPTGQTGGATGAGAGGAGAGAAGTTGATGTTVGQPTAGGAPAGGQPADTAGGTTGR
jgi:hypothetical protein